MISHKVVPTANCQWKGKNEEGVMIIFTVTKITMKVGKNKVRDLECGRKQDQQFFLQNPSSNQLQQERTSSCSLGYGPDFPLTVSATQPRAVEHFSQFLGIFSKQKKILTHWTEIENFNSSLQKDMDSIFSTLRNDFYWVILVLNDRVTLIKCKWKLFSGQLFP